MIFLSGVDLETYAASDLVRSSVMVVSFMSAADRPAASWEPWLDADPFIMRREAMPARRMVR
jgi:hypothetical protein